MAAITPRRSTRAAGSSGKPPGSYPTYGHSPCARKWLPPALLDFATTPGLAGYGYKDPSHLCNPKQMMMTGLYPTPHCLSAFTSIYTRILLACKWHRSDFHTAQNDPVIPSHLQPLTTSLKATYRAILTFLAGVLTVKATYLTVHPICCPEIMNVMSSLTALTPIYGHLHFTTLFHFHTYPPFKGGKCK